MRILVALGATREPIDAVRFLSNSSTGRTGAALADEWARAGHRVDVLAGIGSVRTRFARSEETFGSAADLAARLRRRLGSGRYDAVVMVAGVSDYRPLNPSRRKIPSDAATVRLELARNPKLLPLLKGFSPRPIRVVGFKLTVGAGARERLRLVGAQLESGKVDLVVQNDLSEIERAAVHPFRLYFSGRSRPESVKGERSLALRIDRAWREAGDPGARA